MGVLAGERWVVADVKDDPGAFVFGEPRGLVGAVGEEEQEDYAEENRGDAFDKKEPLPAAKAEVAIEVEEWACDEACDDGAERQ